MISFQNIFRYHYTKLSNVVESNKKEIHNLDQFTRLDDGPIVIIFHYLPQCWDKIHFALTCKKIMKVYQKYPSIQISKETAAKIAALMRIPKEIASAKKSFEKWDKYSSKCPDPGCSNKAIGCLGAVDMYLIGGTIGTGVTACGKLCGCCACCLGTAKWCGVAAGGSGAVSCLCTLLLLGLSVPEILESKSISHEKKLEELQNLRLKLIEELSPPAEIKMEEE